MLCNNCSCAEMEKCSIRGYLPYGSCCDKCEFIKTTNCSVLSISEKVQDEEDLLISQIVGELENKILKNIEVFKEAIITKSRQKVVVPKS